MGPAFAHRVHIAITQSAAHGGGADEGWVADDVVGFWPDGLARVNIAILRHSGGFVRHGFAGHRAGFVAGAVPAADWLAVLVGDELGAGVVDEGVAVLDVVEVAQHRLGRGD